MMPKVDDRGRRLEREHRRPLLPVEVEDDPVPVVLAELLAAHRVDVVGPALLPGRRRETVERDTFSYLTMVNLLKRDLYRRWIAGSTAGLEILAQRPLVRSHVQSLLVSQLEGTHDRETENRLLSEHLEPTLSHEGGFESISIISVLDDTVLVSTDPRLLHTYKGREPFLERAQERTLVQPLAYSDTDRKSTRLNSSHYS